MLAGKEIWRKPLAGKSTLNRMELSDGTPDRYKKITFWKDGIDELLVKVFLESHATAPEEIILDMDTTDLPLHGKQEGRFFHGYYDTTATCRCTSSAESRFCVRACGNPTAMLRPAAWRRSNESWRRSGGVAGGEDHLAGRLRLLPQRVDELVRRQSSGLRIRVGAQSATAEDHRAADAGGDRAVGPDRQTGASV